MGFATRMVRSFKSMDDKYKPEFFFEETKKERMRRYTFSYNYGRDTYKRIHWDLERKIMVLCSAKLAEHFEFYTTFVEVGKLSKVVFYSRPIRNGDYTTVYEVGSSLLQDSEIFDREAFMQGFNACMRRGTGISFGKSKAKPVVV